MDLSKQPVLQIRNPSVVMEKHFSGASSQDHQQIIMITAVIMVTVLSMVLTACHAAIAEGVLLLSALKKIMSHKGLGQIIMILAQALDLEHPSEV